MTPTNEQIMAEVRRRTTAVWGKGLEDTIIEVMREGWTPPEPAVDPDLLAFREWAARRREAINSMDWASAYRQGRFDHSDFATAYLAGARMATERERERAKVLVEFAEDIAKFSRNYAVRAYRDLAKYRGEA